MQKGLDFHVFYTFYGNWGILCEEDIMLSSWKLIHGNFMDTWKHENIECAVVTGCNGLCQLCRIEQQ